MTYNVLMGTLNPTHSLTHSLAHYGEEHWKVGYGSMVVFVLFGAQRPTVERCGIDFSLPRDKIEIKFNYCKNLASKSANNDCNAQGVICYFGGGLRSPSASVSNILTNKLCTCMATQYASAPCKLTSSNLFARWYLFRHVGYLRHQQQVDL